MLPRATALLAALLALAPGRGSAESSPPPANQCVQARGEARSLGFAYDHWVLVNNRCEKPVACTITTSHNPEPVSLGVASHQGKQALVHRASTSRTFAFRIDCDYGELDEPPQE